MAIPKMVTTITTIIVVMTTVTSCMATTNTTNATIDSTSQNDTIEFLRKKIDKLEDKFAKADKVINANMNHFFLIVNAIIVFLVQVNQTKDELRK